jgi:dTDP-4-amino-4,6-dideoxygalactose transaminase
VQAFEQRWAEMFECRHAVTTNSWTTGLMTCIAALGLGPGDELICPPYTMSASAACSLFYGVVPVFADIDPVTFCLDPASVEARITPRTRAIMVVHLFGLPADMDALLAVAVRHDLRVVEDAAQAPLARYRDRLVGSIGDIGGFSLNYHKHIHTGEGGVVSTNDDDLALRCQLVRNHGENAVGAMEIDDITNLVGSNFRLTELQAAIGIAQLARLPGILATRERLAAHLSQRLRGCPGISVPEVPDDRSHSWYLYALRYDEERLGVGRERFIAAVNAELPAPTSFEDTALWGGYVEPLYLSPLYQQRVAIGRAGYPFGTSDVPPEWYERGSCPTTEDLYDRTLMLTGLVREPLSFEDIDDLADAIVKVAERADSLR